jgi:hypothetical protein
MFNNYAGFYGGDLLAPHLTPKLEDHPLLAVRDIYSLYSQLPYILDTVPPRAGLCPWDNRGKAYNWRAPPRQLVAVPRLSHGQRPALAPNNARK